MATLTRYPTNNAVVNTGWTNPTYAYNADGVQLATGAPARNAAFYSDFGGFGFDSLIPVGAVIGNVTVEVYGKCSAQASQQSLRWRPVISGTPYGTERIQASVATALTTYSQVWTGLTRDQLLDAAFKVRLGCYRTNTTSYTFSVDFVRVTVEYSLPTLAITGAGDIASAEAVGSPAVTPGPVSVTGAGGIGTAEAFGSPSVTVMGQAQDVSGAGGIGSAEAFGAPTVTVAPPAQSVTGAGAIASAEGFGAAQVSVQAAEQQVATGGGMRKTVGLIRYGSFEQIPSHLRRVAAIRCPPGVSRRRMETSAQWFNPGDVVPSWMVQYGAVECSVGSEIPANVITIAAL
jgi:hypothetical protein